MCPILPKCQYLMKCWTEFGDIQSVWSANGVVSNLCDWATQDGRRLLFIHENENSQEPLNEFILVFCHIRMMWEAITIFHKLAASAITKNSEIMKQTISHELCHTDVFIESLMCRHKAGAT